MNLIKMSLATTTILFFITSLVLAGQNYQTLAEGRVGDYAYESRIYEIDGYNYIFPPYLTSVNSKGKHIKLSSLQGGATVKILGTPMIKGKDSDDPPADPKFSTEIKGKSGRWFIKKLIVLSKQQKNTQRNSSQYKELSGNDNPKSSSPEKPASQEIYFENGVWKNR